MSNITNAVVWICSKFSSQQVEAIVTELSAILKDANSRFGPRDKFKEEHPNYRDFAPDPTEPLTEPTKKNQKDYKLILQEYEQIHNKAISPVNCKSPQLVVPKDVTCPHCNAPHQYIYFNNGKKRTQLKCKVCAQTFQLCKPLRKSKAKYYCPHCGHALFQWKHHFLVTTYKCSDDNCPYRIKRLNQLKPSEMMIQKMKPSQFKINYQYREYHLKPIQIQHAAPAIPGKEIVDIFKIRKPDNILGLALTFYISFALSARKTALIIRWFFGEKCSYQTVLNYAKAVAHYAHRFNLKNKGDIDAISVGDETYIKIGGEFDYVWFYLSANKRSITAYHLADNRGTIPAVAATNEAIRTADIDQNITLVTDGNPSYIEAIQFLNKDRPKEHKIKHIQVIGLQNNDDVSEEFRPFKQIIERFNRTYKHHIKPAAGFNCFDGAMALTTLFVTYYNFLRPHATLNFKPPLHIAQLDNIKTIQAKWLKLISMMY